MIETIIEFINGILGDLLSFLPTSPFSEFINTMSTWEWIGWLNWLVPVGDFIKIGEAWLGAVGIYYLWQVVLRWIRAVQ